LLLCSAFVEHYCKTRLFVFITAQRKLETIELPIKGSKFTKWVFIFSKLKKIISNFSQRNIIDIGLLYGAWDDKLSKKLVAFNKERNKLVHYHENILSILKKEEKEKVEKIIDHGLSLLDNVKFGFIKS